MINIALTFIGQSLSENSYYGFTFRIRITHSTLGHSCVLPQVLLEYLRVLPEYLNAQA